ncbi:HflK protein [candidate division KSB1 bacterium 4484_87]|nr:MAG: HflK protein [candidate division KSB1 bacterium 4484_87]
MQGYRGGRTVNIGGEEIVLPPINRKFIIYGIAIIVLIVLVFSTYYTVKTEEVGVIKRFGKYVRTTPPGLHFKLPLGIETVNKVKGGRYIFREEFGYRTTKPGIRTEIRRDRGLLSESLMLTGDLNIATVEWVVQYRIKDPKAYLFHVRDIRKTIRDVSESVTRQVIGDHSVDEVWILLRPRIALNIRENMQAILDEYRSGIDIETVELQDVNPPEKVRPAVNEVNEARQEMEKLINQANEAYNKVIPRAKGEAEKTIRQAEGYALDRINSALGDAARFNEIYREYRSSKNVTRRRMYLETMTKILPKIERKYIIDKDQKGLLQLLQLQEGGAKK